MGHIYVYQVKNIFQNMKDSYVSVNYYMVRCRLAFCHARLNAPSFALSWKLNSPRPG